MQRREVLGLIGLVVAGGSGFCEFARAEDKIRIFYPLIFSKTKFRARILVAKKLKFCAHQERGLNSQCA